MLVGPNDSFDDVIYNVGVGDRADAHAGQGIGGCEGIVGCYVSVADLASGVDPPVEGVKVDPGPFQFDDIAPSS